MKKHKAKSVTTSVTRPKTRVFDRKAKKPGDDDRPGPFRPKGNMPAGKPSPKAKKLRGVMI